MKPLVGTALLLIGSVVAGYSQAPAVAAGGVLNGASFAKGQAVAAGSLVSIFGTNLAAGTAQADTIPLSTKLGNVTVTFNGASAPLLFVNGGQINAQLPWEIADGPAQVVVNNNGTSSAPATFQVGPSPGIFAFGSQAIAYGNSDGLLAAAPGAINGLTTHPAKIGDETTLVILATGLGPVNPPVQTGNNVTDGQLHQTLNTPTVLVGGVPAAVKFSGMTPQFVGVYQINIVIAPGTPTGNAIPLQLQMNGITTTNQVTIAVSQ